MQLEREAERLKDVALVDIVVRPIINPKDSAPPHIARFAANMAGRVGGAKDMPRGVQRSVFWACSLINDRRAAIFTCSDQRYGPGEDLFQLPDRDICNPCRRAILIPCRCVPSV